MAFTKTGVVTAPKIVPSAFGLLAVVKPENGPSEDQWVRGFSQEWETEVSNLVIWDDTDTTVDGIGERTAPKRHNRVKPFFIEATEDISTLGFLALDRVARLSRQIEGGSQKAIEQELWDGVIRKTETHDNAALSSGTVTILGGGTAYSAKRALAILEQGIADASQFGEQGLIHMTRDVAALLSSNSQMLFHDKEKEHLQTLGGTPVVVGNGYSGNGPTWTVNAVSVNSNELILVTTSAHNLQDGDRVSLTITSETLETVTLTNVEATRTSGTEFKVDYTHANVTVEDATGSAQQLGTASAKWIYATGTVKVYLGDVDVVNDNLSQAYDVSGNANDMRLKAIRPAAVYFDTSIHLAVRVDLTA